MKKVIDYVLTAEEEVALAWAKRALLAITGVRDKESAMKAMHAISAINKTEELTNFCQEKMIQSDMTLRNLIVGSVQRAVSIDPLSRDN